MRYLDKTFTIAVSDRHIIEKTPRPAPRVPHEYLPFGPVCYECGFDRIGCAARFGKKEEDIGGSATSKPGA